MTPEQTKNLKIGTGVVAGLGLLYLLFGNKKENSGNTADPTGNGSYTPALNVFNAKSVSLSLYDAMKESGTEEEAILEALKTVNQAQFAQVVTAFGKRYYNTTTGNQYQINPFLDLPKLPLKTWLNEELSVKDYAILRNKYPYLL